MEGSIYFFEQLLLYSTRCISCAQACFVHKKLTISLVKINLDSTLLGWC